MLWLLTFHLNNLLTFGECWVEVHQVLIITQHFEVYQELCVVVGSCWGQKLEGATCSLDVCLWLRLMKVNITQQGCLSSSAGRMGFSGLRASDAVPLPTWLVMNKETRCPLMMYVEGTQNIETILWQKLLYLQLQKQHICILNGCSFRLWDEGWGGK